MEDYHVFFFAFFDWKFFLAFQRKKLEISTEEMASSNLFFNMVWIFINCLDSSDSVREEEEEKPNTNVE